VFDELLARESHAFNEGLTLGSLIHLLGIAMRGHVRYPDGQAVAAYLLELNVDANQLRPVVADLRQLNIDFRIPAASQRRGASRTVGEREGLHPFSPDRDTAEAPSGLRSHPREPPARDREG